MGEAAGIAAAIGVREGHDFEQLVAQDITEIQQRLLANGCHLPNYRNEDAADLARLAEVSASSDAPVHGVAPETPCHHDGLAVWKDQPQYGIERLETRRGQLIAVSGGRIETIELCLTNDSDVEHQLELVLSAADHIWDYRAEPGKPLATGTITVPPGKHQWIAWPVSLQVPADLTAGRFLRVDALANKAILWHAAKKIIPGHMATYAISPNRMRRYGNGHTLAYRITPEQRPFGAAQVLSGVTRPHRATNLWVSRSGAAPAAMARADVGESTNGARNPARVSGPSHPRISCLRAVLSRPAMPARLSCRGLVEWRVAPSFRRARELSAAAAAHAVGVRNDPATARGGQRDQRRSVRGDLRNSMPGVIRLLALLGAVACLGGMARAEAPFAKGADVGWLSEMEANGDKFYDASGKPGDCLQILKDYGINAVRLRVWVNPKDGWCGEKDVVTMAKRAQEMGLARDDRFSLQRHLGRSAAPTQARGVEGPRSRAAREGCLRSHLRGAERVEGRGRDPGVGAGRQRDHLRHALAGRRHEARRTARRDDQPGLRRGEGGRSARHRRHPSRQRRGQ